MFTVKTRRVIGNRPDNIPTDALVFNAPRPLAGAVRWHGDFVSGIFYAAVTKGEYREADCKENIDLDAVLIEYLSEAEAMDLVRQAVVSFLENHPKAKIPRGLSLDDYVAQNWRTEFSLKHCVGSREI